MTKFFLRAKHWQLFLIMLLSPFLISFLAGIMIALTSNIQLMLMMYPVIILILMIFYFGWFYSVGTHLHQKLPSTVNMNLGRFKFFVLVPVIYFVLFSLILGWIVSTFESTPSIARRYGSFESLYPGARYIEDLLPYFIPFHLFAIYSMFYCFYFVAKELRSVELQQEVTVSDYIGEFLLIWISIIGIWFIQPRVNRIFGFMKEESMSLDDHLT
jgi:hypothetical protein